MLNLLINVYRVFGTNNFSSCYGGKTEDTVHVFKEIKHIEV